MCWRCYYGGEEGQPTFSLPLSPLALFSPSFSNKILQCCQVTTCQVQECYSALACVSLMLPSCCKQSNVQHVPQSDFYFHSNMESAFFSHMWPTKLEIQLKVIHANILRGTNSADLDKSNFKSQSEKYPRLVWPIRRWTWAASLWTFSIFTIAFILCVIKQSQPF